MNTVGKCLLGGGVIAGTVTLARNEKVRKAAKLGTIAAGTAAGVALATNPASRNSLVRAIKTVVEHAKTNGIKATFSKIFNGLKKINYKNEVKSIGSIVKESVTKFAGKLKGKSVKEIFTKGLSKFKALPGPAKAIAAIGTLLFAGTLFKKSNKA